MKLALFGKGTMGQLVSARAKDEGHEVGLILDSSAAQKSHEELNRVVPGARLELACFCGAVNFESKTSCDIKRSIEQQRVIKAFDYSCLWLSILSLFHVISPYISKSHH